MQSCTLVDHRRLLTLGTLQCVTHALHQQLLPQQLPLSRRSAQQAGFATRTVNINSAARSSTCKLQLAGVHSCCSKAGAALSADAVPLGSPCQRAL
jgi:hypothetical protein